MFVFLVAVSTHIIFRIQVNCSYVSSVVEDSININAKANNFVELRKGCTLNSFEIEGRKS